MAIYQGVNGVNREIKQIFEGVGGVNHEVKERWEGVGGVNRQVFSSWNGILYDNGVENLTVAGGWKVGYSLSTGSQQKTTLYLECMTTNDRSPRRSYQTAEQIDLTKYNNLHFDIECLGSKYAILCGFKEDMSDYINAPIYSVYSDVGRKIVTLNIASIVGSYYLSFFSNSNGSYNTSRVYKVWLS